MRYKDRLVVPSNEELRRKVLNEVHHSKLSIHPGSNKMYHDLCHLYWWSNMKQDITKYVTECDTWGRVKADHMHTPGSLTPKFGKLTLKRKRSADHVKNKKIS